MPTTEPSEMEREADAAGESLPRELWAFIWQNKKWWLIPIVVALLILSVIVIVGGSSVAPFIYPLF